MAQQNGTKSIVCRRCGVADREHDSAYDAIRSGWRLRRVGEGPAKDYVWLCVACAQSERPPAEPSAPSRAATRRSG